MNAKHFLAALLAASTLLGCQTKTTDPTEQKINDLLAQMTLDEKIGQMNQLQAVGASDDRIGQIKAGQVGSILNEIDPAVINELQRVAVEETRLHIPIVFARDVIHGFKTIFPIPLGQAASWNPQVAEDGARVAAIEATASGIRWTFSPMVDVSRDPRWGRIAESYGEDTYLSCVMGAATVRGYQTNDLTQPNTMAACVKHFAGYGVTESGRDYNTTWIPEVQLRDVYLPPFKASADAGAATFMCSFNDINGVPSSGNKHLNIDILRNEWGYDGVLVSDWGSAAQMVPHGFCADMKDAAATSANAGMDMDMESHAYVPYLKELVNEGKVSEKTIDMAVRNVLRLKFRLGLFDNPYTQIPAEMPFYTQESLAKARNAVAEGAVLLKNSGVLPVQKVKSVAVVGPLANAPLDQIGTWCFDAEPEHCVTPIMAITNEYGQAMKVIAEPGLTYSRDKSAAGIQKAVAAARQADVVLYFAGEEAILSGEAKCRADISLPGAQTEMLRQLKATGKPVVMIVMAGRQLTIGEESEMADAVIYSFHAGTMAGPGLADVIFGKVVPSGKLPVTFPKMVGQVPMYYNHKNTGRPASNITLIDDIPVGAPQFSIGSTSYHLDAGSEPLYPFGYGLSYTTFEYGQVKLDKTELTNGGTITATCDITNSGKYDAQEVAQLYVRDLVGELCRPVRELKGFQKVMIKAGETKTVSFTLSTNDLAYWHADLTSRTDAGDFQLWIAPDSQRGDAVMFTLK